MPTLPPLGEVIAVLTPISRPSLSSNGPPELPGFSAASVWITSRLGVRRRLNLPVQGDDDAVGQGGLLPERAADGVNGLADFQVLSTCQS